MEKKTDDGWEPYTPPNPGALKAPNPLGDRLKAGARNNMQDLIDKTKNPEQREGDSLMRIKAIPTSEDLKRKNK
jgi:hypothetical protein